MTTDCGKNIVNELVMAGGNRLAAELSHVTISILSVLVKQLARVRNYMHVSDVCLALHSAAVSLLCVSRQNLAH